MKRENNARQHSINIISRLKQVIPYIKSKMKAINLMHAMLLPTTAGGKPITGSFKHISNTSQLETLNRNGAFELINLHVADKFVFT